MKNSTYKLTNFTITIFFVFGVFCILVLFWQRLAFPEDWKILGRSSEVELSSNFPVTQKFTALENNFSQVNMLMDNTGLEKDETLTVAIYDENCKNPVRENSIWKGHLLKGYDVFAFDPIKDSKGKEFCLHVIYTATQPHKSRPSIGTMKAENEIFIDSAEPSNKYAGKTLLFHPAYKKSFAETAEELSRRIGAYKAIFVKNYILEIIAGFFALTFLVPILLFWQKEEE